MGYRGTSQQESATGQAGASPGPSMDGRTARRERGRAAVIDAVFELLSEGQIPPEINDLAARSGVSVSSIFRYFDGMVDVQFQAMDRFQERFVHLFILEGRATGPLDDRIHVFVDARLAMLNEVAPILEVARLRALEHELFVAGNQRISGRLRDQVLHQFNLELHDLTPANSAALAAAVDSFTSPESWGVLMKAHDRSHRQIRQTWIKGLAGLFAAWAPKQTPEPSAVQQDPNAGPIEAQATEATAPTPTSLRAPRTEGSS